MKAQPEGREEVVEVETGSASGANQTGQHFSTLKAQTPVYDDVFNDLFADKRHQAYRIVEKVEKRTAII